MSSFFSQEAKSSAKQAIQEVESHTAAEIVVMVRRRSSHYLHVDAVFGFLVALGVLAALLFLPQPFATIYFPLEVAGAFIVGGAICRHAPPLRRLLSRRGQRLKNVRTAAHAAFFAQGLTNTSGRTGILFFVSTFERRCFVVTDHGVPVHAMKKEWATLEAAADRAVQNADWQGFSSTLLQLSAPLSRVLPRADDDINELADEVRS